jgi:hypothetical protein
LSSFSAGDAAADDEILDAAGRPNVSGGFYQDKQIMTIQGGGYGEATQ